MSDNTRWVASVELTDVKFQAEIAVRRLGEREIALDPSKRRLARTDGTRDAALARLSMAARVDPFWLYRTGAVDSACVFLMDNEGFSAFRVTTPC